MNKGIRLWLDDNRPAPEGWVHAHNVEEAKVRLLQRNVEDLSLDFDLDNPPCPNCDFKCGHFENGCQKKCPCHQSNGRENGLALIEWMVHWNIWPKHKPVVHSVNADGGADSMRALIEAHFPE